ncbi:hypothetical protein ACQY1H_23505 (plasmid) [Agrobacterium vitis]|uniref:hypothetical protein n=1 Tax=Agrobacterium vitis TaxID=373 RepID=UPI003D2A7FF1
MAHTSLQADGAAHVAADHRRFAWMNAVLTFLVALALFFVPAAGGEAMQCHDHQAHGHFGSEQASVLAKDVHASSPGGFHTPDHKNCCAVQCGFCIVLASADRTEAPATIGSSLHFVWGNQTGSGLALPPTLGPPRFSV